MENSRFEPVVRRDFSLCTRFFALNVRLLVQNLVSRLTVVVIYGIKELRIVKY